MNSVGFEKKEAMKQRTVTAAVAHLTVQEFSISVTGAADLLADESLIG